MRTVIAALATIAVLAAAAGMTAPAAGAEAPEKPAQPAARTGGRMVGVASVCHPARAAAKDVERLIDAAALDRPDIILLTEGFMHNTPPGAPLEEKNAKAEPLDGSGAILSLLARKAREHRAYLIGSTWRKDPDGRGRYNTAFLLDRAGKVAWHYDKVYPTIGEMEGGVLPGAGPRVFDADFGRIGAVICFDLNFHELLEAYERQGVELLCFVSAFRGGFAVRSLAFRHRMFIASSVPGENGVIVDPMGRVLAESSQYGRTIFARINLDSAVVHIDYNHRRIPALKERYGPLVRVETFSPEAVYFLSSLHPERSVQEMMREFEIEPLGAYFDRARAVRKEHLPGE
jgi:predicted amidohydrolase